MRTTLNPISLLLLPLALILLNCTGLQPQKNAQQLYEQAILDAAVINPDKIMPLLPIPTTEDVTVISWITEARTPCKSGESTCEFINSSDRIWVTLDGEVKHACQSWHLHNDALSERLDQFLGLPPNPPSQHRKVKFAIMKVPAKQLERACLGINTTDVVHPQCTLDTQDTTPDDLRSYVQQHMASSYIVHNPRGPGYPFTRLGYTYDWNELAGNHHHYGASEFLIMPNTPIKVVEMISTDDYCK